MGRRVIIMAGGTGGHVYPALAVANLLIAEGHQVTWLGTRKGLEARVVPAAGIKVEWLAVSGVRGKSLMSRVRAPLMIVRALWQSLKILRRIQPDVVLGMGGFVAGPGGLVAAVLGIPLVLHEQNRIPGTTNRWLARWADRVLEAFEGSFPPRCRAIAVGNPVRADIAALIRHPRAPWADRPLRILVVGGSLGALALNEIVPEALASLGRSVAIRHQTGPRFQEKTEARYLTLGLEAEVLAYMEDMAEAYRWADVAICRAGAMTVSELALAGLPAVLIPYPHAIDDHQTANARLLADPGGALLLPQGDLTPHNLALALNTLFDQEDAARHMSHALRLQARPEAAAVVAEHCLSVIPKKSRLEERSK